MKEVNEDGDSASPVSQKMNISCKTGDQSERDEVRIENKQLFCCVCRTDFFSLNSLKDHLREMHVFQRNTKSFSCGSCNQSYKSLLTAINHILRMHTKEKIGGCGKCGLKYPYPRSVSTICGMKGISDRYCKKCKRESRESEVVEVQRELRALTCETKIYYKKRRPKGLPIKEEAQSEEDDLEGQENISCEYCQLSFPTAKALERHVRLSHPDKGPHIRKTKVYPKRRPKEVSIKEEVELEDDREGPENISCEYCQLSFPSAKALECHIRLSHPGQKTPQVSTTRVYPNRQLKEMTIKEEETQPEKDNQEGQENISCEYCQLSSPSVKALERHVRLSHPDKGPHIRETKVYPKRRSKEVPIKEEVQSEEDDREGPENISCEYCQLNFPSAKALERHIRDSHPDKGPHVRETRVYTKRRIKGVPIKEEVQSEEDDGEGQENISCEYCQFSFPSVNALQRHIRGLHPGKGPRPHVCETCGKTFLLKQSLVAHSIVHLPQHHCDMCGVDFATRRKLLAHQSRVHTVGRPHVCSICNKTFKNRRSLRSHFRKHTESYVCETCGKVFSDRSYLSVHKRTHTGERPYPCPGCDKKFSTQRHLKTHFRIHTGEKPYVCETCDRAFTRKEHLKTHLRVHTGEKPYVCDVCQRGFSQKWVMYTHRRIHTGERPFECEICQRGFIYKSQLKTHKLTHANDSAVNQLDSKS